MIPPASGVPAGAVRGEGGLEVGSIQHVPAG